MTTTVDGSVSVRAVAKTFASGKTEKHVYTTLEKCALPSGKVCTYSSSSLAGASHGPILTIGPRWESNFGLEGRTCNVNE